MKTFLSMKHHKTHVRDVWFLMVCYGVYYTVMLSRELMIYVFFVFQAEFLKYSEATQNGEKKNICGDVSFHAIFCKNI